jgi:hypothetical protein
MQSARAVFHVDYTVVCSLNSSTVFFQSIPQTARLTERKSTEHTMRVLIFSTNLPETIFILSRTERDSMINLHTSSCKAHFILANFYSNLNFLDRFSKNTQISDFMKTPSNRIRVVPCGRKEREKDMTKLIVIFRNFVNASKNGRERSTGKAEQDVKWQIKWFGPFKRLLGTTKIHIMHDILITGELAYQATLPSRRCWMLRLPYFATHNLSHCAVHI